MAGDIWRGYDASSSISIRLWCSELVVIWRFVALIWSLSSILLCSNAASDHVESRLHGPSADFGIYSLVQPRVFHARSKREILDTRENNHLHTEVLSVGLQVNGVDRILDLRLNTDLIPLGFRQKTQQNGTFKIEIPKKVEICHYQGSIRGIPDSWVAVSTCKGLTGTIFDGENTHYIHSENESIDSNHYIYKHSDLLANNTCGYEGTVHEVEDSMPSGHRLTRSKRSTEVVRGPYNANRQSRYVELVLVIDKKEYMALDENLDKVYHHCKDIANIINALYTPLNIFVALVGVEVWTESDHITLSPKGDTTLANFLRYRREMLVKDMPNDNAQLLTRITFDDGVVGKALKGPICTYEFSGGVSMDHSNVIGLVAATVAHEMGHNFGMEHDSAECSCPEDRCIMAPSSGSTGPTHWSSCSLDYLSQAFQHGMDYCLRNKPQKLFDSPICGNGFVESGEQCDCGLEENCDNPCCNATTCMLHANASCATGECCDLKTCRPKNAGTECRSAEHECDLPEYCTGQSEYCPSDVYKVDGEACSMGKAYCYQGSCRTHNDQCKLLWGPSGTSSDAQCYDMNNKGTKNGNCGYNRTNASYFKCNDHDILCGMLHCKHLNERLEFGMESVAILSHSFINNGGIIIACRTAIVDLGLNQVDPGLAPDGAKCAPGKMCVNQKCLPVEDLRVATIGRGACPNNCGGNGVCNSLGHCHCNHGFRPPDCVRPGFGGSDDSGPAQDPNARNDMVTALYIIFLGILPMIALVSLAMWYRKNNLTRPGWKKDVLPTYVSSLVCSKKLKLPNLNAPKSPKTKMSSRVVTDKKFFVRIREFFTSRNDSRPSDNQLYVDATKIFTISDNTLKRDKINITRKNLVSTTNPEAINCSSNITARNSLLINNSVRDNNEEIAVDGGGTRCISSQFNADSPKPAEFGSIISERIKSLQKSSKNFHGLKLNTEMAFEHLNESPSSSSADISQNKIDDATIYSNVSKNIPKIPVGFKKLNEIGKSPNVDQRETINANQAQQPMPFYNKKPPPPPATSQHLKPKI